MQTDPIGYDDGMNMYAYVGNDPVNGVDPTGNNTLVLNGARMLAVPAPGARVVGGLMILAGVAIALNNSSDTPDLPKDLVGDQSDDRAGSNKSGKRHTSGPLTPENGGTGDYETDLETLAGPTRVAGEGDSAPPGSPIGENGVFGRSENSDGGSSIEIPVNGDKPHESLHYDKKKFK